jgi:O-antigen ligase
VENKDVSKQSDYFNGKIIQTGIASGSLLFMFSWLAFTFHFSKVNPVSPVLFLHQSTAIQHIIAALIIIFISIVLSLSYYALFRKKKPLLTGIVVSIVLFLLLVSFISRSTLNLITVFCLLLCYCVFISISASWIHERGR